MAITWITETNLGKFLENSDIGSIFLHATDTSALSYSVVGDLPNGLSLTGDMLQGKVDFLDNWYYTLPDFSYNTLDEYGGNYSKYGAGYYQTTVLNITVRAYNTLSPEIYLDKTFTLTIETDYSTLRDKFLIENMTDTNFTINGEKISPQEFLDYYKDRKYYV